MEWEKKCRQREDEIRRYQERVSRLLRDCFFDYESHYKDTPLDEQITLLEGHLQKRKDKTLKTDAKRNRSKSGRKHSLQSKPMVSIRGGNAKVISHNSSISQMHSRKLFARCNSGMDQRTNDNFGNGDRHWTRGDREAPFGDQNRFPDQQLGFRSRRDSAQMG